MDYFGRGVAKGEGRNDAFIGSGMGSPQPLNLEVLERKLDEHLRQAHELRVIILREKERRRRIMEQQRMAQDPIVALTDPTVYRRLSQNRYMEEENQNQRGVSLLNRKHSYGGQWGSPALQQRSITMEAIHSNFTSNPFATQSESKQLPGIMGMNQQMSMFKQRQANNRRAQLPKKKWLQCSHCPKLFQNKSRLERHMRSHTGERPFQCSVCGDRFKQKCHLTVHLRRHQDSKCPVCGDQYMKKEDLLAHMSTHLDVLADKKETNSDETKLDVSTSKETSKH
mmetsp:Transcript_2972/g.4066  ORF Transcript_2972/g.4066 Transcript_2972/m.4066 type:complete len:282 (+) Transcript_2972:114-959(+)